MKLALPCAFLLDALIHLWACAARRQRVQAATKPLLLPLLLGYYLCAARRPDLLAVPAILFGFLGDTFLLFSPNRSPAEGGAPDVPLLLGLTSFLLGHLCYIAVFLRAAAQAPPAWALVLGPVLYAGLFLLLFRSLRPHMGTLLLPGTAYLAVLVSMACAAALTGPFPPLRLLGGLLFVLSDYVLARSILLGGGKYTDLWVMTTYLAAQVLLVCSLL